MILAQGVRMPGVAACEAVLGCGESRAYELLGLVADGDHDALPFPVIVARPRSAGRRCRYWVPTSAVLAVLGLVEPVEVG